MVEPGAVRIRPVKIIAAVLSLIAGIWLIVSIAGSQWVGVKFRYHGDKTWTWGLWWTCNILNSTEIVCIEADWVTACGVFSIISLLASMGATVFGSIGLLVANTIERKRMFYVIAGGLNTFASILELLVVIIFPVKFGEDIMNSTTVRRWDFDWTYGFAWGGFIFSLGSAIFFLLPTTKDDQEARFYSTQYT